MEQPRRRTARPPTAQSGRHRHPPPCPKSPGVPDARPPEPFSIFISRSCSELTQSPSRMMSIVRHYNNRGYQEPGQHSTEHLSKERYTLHPDDEDFLSGYQEIDLPFKCLTKRYFTIVGLCNGVILLCGDYSNHEDFFIFWNPGIRKALYVPMARFAVRDGQWRLFNATRPWHDYLLSSKFLLNGSTHWLFCDSDEAGYTHFQTVTFDLARETFGEILLPKVGFSHVEYSAIIKVYMDMLAIVRDFENHPTIWVMNEYGVADSWSKLVRFEHLHSLLIFGFRSNGEILYLDPAGPEDDEYDDSLSSEDLGMLFPHQPANGMTKRFGKIYGETLSYELIRYVPTLGLLKKGQTITECSGERHGQLLHKDFNSKYDCWLQTTAGHVV
ncbi:hypothetical protein AKJ16_DCAP21009 [Drosera capensis]